MIDEVPKQLITIANDYLKKVIDAPLNEVGGILSDTIGYWRFKNKVNTIIKAKVFLEEKGINPQKLIPDIFVPLIEESGNVSNPDLAGKYASLLACHLDPDSQDLVHPSFSKSLSQLSGTDVKILDYLYKGIKKLNANYKDKNIKLETVCRIFNVNENQAMLSFQNIWRLGICGHGPNLNFMNQTRQLVFSEYGWNFITCCHKIDE